ncbi:MAG: AarF/ABC1/UbiB kinase family protein [Microbacteriaceae bacterium]|nr:AarF/ABC1/UbiB kinase family protein [Microbacteriaceae bacterium]
MKSRYRRILRFAAWALIQTWWFELVLPKFGLKGWVAARRIARYRAMARRFSLLAASLGGLIIKAGQFASSRLDILPAAITAELESLQDDVAPEAFDRICAQIEEEMSLPLDVAFDSFDAQPIAAASLGQAYRARLAPRLAKDYGVTDVVVKVLRPGIEEIVDVDLRALRRIGQWLSRIKLVARRTDAPALVEEFAAVSLDEINYRHESKNLERFRTNFETDSRVGVPDVVWERSTRRVLTLEDVTAIKINDVPALVAAGINPNAVAAELARVTFEQIFNHGFFHADPHPGNIFVTPRASASGVDFSLTFIDFGMMGEIGDPLRDGLQQFIFALVARDARGSVDAMQRLGVLLPSADAIELEMAIAAVFNRFGGVGVAEITQTDPKVFRELAIQFSDLVRTLPFQLPEDFLMLLRSISLISGVTSALNRDFNMWDAVDPFARTLLSGGGTSTVTAIGRQVLTVLTTLSQLPQRLDSVLTRLDQGLISIRLPELEKRVRRLDGSTRRLSVGVLASALIVGGILLRIAGDELGNVLLIASIPLALHALGMFRLP